MAGKKDSTGYFSVVQPSEAQEVVNAVGQWFTASENTKWLLIFDNLDDLQSFDIDDYTYPRMWSWHGYHNKSAAWVYKTRPPGVWGEPDAAWWGHKGACEDLTPDGKRHMNLFTL